MTPVLIVNADDLGLSEGVNDGVAIASERGIVTSASLMVDAPAATGGGRLARTRPTLSVGLHADLGEWVYLDGSWQPGGAVVDVSDPAAVRRALRRQLESFAALTGRPPTHLDSHQHVHTAEPARSVFRRVAQKLRIPLRGEPGIAYCGAFYGQSGTGDPYPEGITAEALITLVSTLDPGTTELGCHPGVGSEHGSAYGVERAVELEALCDSRVRAACERAGVALRSFSTL